MGFYEKNGFVSIGDSFFEDGIKHIKMYLKKQAF
jgi:predicted GNAT family N-acyltransferase